MGKSNYPDPKEFLCCTNPCMHKGDIWGMWPLRVDVCCHCQEAVTKFGWFGEVVLTIGSAFNTHPGFAIKLRKRTQHEIKN